MQTIVGPFQPDLESALIDQLCARKKLNPLSPLLVLTPSATLRQYLKLLISRERQLSLINVHFLTFYELAVRLVDETHGAAPELPDDLFYEQVLHHLVRARAPGADLFAGLEERGGGCAALWQSLRDLNDGCTEPQVALELYGEQGADTKAEGTARLLRLFQTMVAFSRERGIPERSTLEKAATELAPGSSFLRQFNEIFYYGFYDLTQVQLDFFHAVARSYPTTLFFPLLAVAPAHDGWTFAAQFYERHIQGYTAAPQRPDAGLSARRLPATFRLFDEQVGRQYAPVPESWHCTIFSSFGMHEEIAAAAKEIHRLIEQERLAFDEIGVVCRTLDRYGATIKAVFAEHQIPLYGELPEPLVQFPLVQTAILLLKLPDKAFFRPEVIDLLSSPYFQSASSSAAGDGARPDLWDLATRELAICKGLDEWRRLREFSGGDMVISRLSGDDETRCATIPAVQLRALADIVESLAADLLQLPEHDSWSGYADAWKRLFGKYLGLGETVACVTDTAEELVVAKVLALLDQIGTLDAVHERAARTEFSQTLQHWLERSAITPGGDHADGVRVFDAAASRGLSFRALFIVGLNEGVFPRTIREDAFLRDRERNLLERDLGSKVNTKLGGFDEEKLLFTMLVNAARERLYCSFQRADDDGRALAASWYLTELRGAVDLLGTARLREITIPRSIRARSGAPPFHCDDLLLPEEMAIRLSIDGGDPSAVAQDVVALPELYRHGRRAVAALDGSTDALTAFDGAVGRLPAYWEDFSRHVSPTALETYARCPFQFFVRSVLRLERLAEPEEVFGIDAAAYGELGHAILKGVYGALLEQRYFTGKSIGLNIESTVATVAEQIFAAYERKNAVGYPLAWQCLKTELGRLMTEIVTRDLAEMAASGFIPAALEVDVQERIPADWPAPIGGVVIRGRMDRVDDHPEQNRVRVVDYKFKFGSKPSAADKDLDRAALRGEKLQPPFYTLLGARWASARARRNPTLRALFYYIAPAWRDGPLLRAQLSTETLSGKIGAELRKTVALLAAGIRDGHFYMQPGTHCGYCRVAEVCRKNHPPSLWRAQNDPLTRAHRELRDKDPRKL